MTARPTDASWTSGARPATGEQPRATPGSRRPLVVLGAVWLAVVVAWASGALQAAGTLGGRFLSAYVDAQQAMLAARDNVTPDGLAEFAVMLADDVGTDAFRDAIAATAGVRFLRESLFSGWVVVAAAPGDTAALDALRGHPGAKLVIPNRGLWICH